MKFLQPLGLLGLIGVPIIIIIYILRSQFKTKNVSSTFIWKRSLKYVKRRVPIQFIMSLILVLQILTVVAASFAIARPTINPYESNESILIIDASASMLTKEGDKSRFDIAKEKVVEASEAIGPNNQVTLIVAGKQAEQLTEREIHKEIVLTEMQGISCTQGKPDISGALTLASKIQEKNSAAKIKLFTDKDYMETDGVEVITCRADNEWNAGIVSATDNVLATGTEIIVELENYGSTASFNVILYIDGVPVANKTISMYESEVKTVRFTHSKNDVPDQERIPLTNAIKSYSKAEIELVVEDSLPEDNTFTLYPKEKNKPSIMFISKHVVEENGRKNCYSSLIYTTLLAGGYTIHSDNMYSSPDQVKKYEGFDLYIFEGVYIEDEADMPTDGTIWLLNLPGNSKYAGIVLNERVRDAEKEENDNGYAFVKSTLNTSNTIANTIVNQVNFETPAKFGTLIIKAALMRYQAIDKMGESFQPIYSCNGTPVMVAGRVGSVRVVATSFDFANSSLPMFVSDFPVLIDNMVSYSTPDPMPERTTEVGSEITFVYPAGAQFITYKYNGELVTEVDIQKLIADVAKKNLEAEQTGKDKISLEEALEMKVQIEAIGTYEFEVVYEDGTKKTFSVTGQIPRDESAILQEVATDNLDVPELTVDPGEVVEPVEIFPYIVAILIALLIIEWGVYYRDQY